MSATKIILICFLGGVAIIAPLLSYYLEGHELTLESFESKTLQGHPVYNKIQFSQVGNKDIWLMKQSQEGFQLPEQDWDQLKITIDKEKTPYVASYSQSKNGVETEYRVSCFLCHANGPRAIRPNFNSPTVQYRFKDLLAVGFWNLKIKHYPLIHTPQNKTLGGSGRRVLLKSEGTMDQETLDVKTCNYCHGEKSLLGRSGIERQHQMAVRHLIEQNHMPPWPLKLDLKEKEQILAFLEGF